MYQSKSVRFMLFGIVIDVLEILGFLTLFLVIGALIMAPGGPKGVIKFIKKPPVIPVIGIKQFIIWYGRILIPISLVLALIFLISAGGIIDQMATRDWSATEATVIESEIESESSCTTDDSGYQDCTTSSWLVVTYAYQVNFENYTSNRYTFIGELDDSMESDYPIGKAITAYVDPEDPSKSVLIKGFDPVWEEMLAATFFFVLIATFTTYFLVLWKIAYHIQPAANRAKAREAPEWEWKGFRELFSSSQLASDLNHLIGFKNVMKESSKNVYDGSSKDLIVEIDGNRGSHTIKSMNDILMVLQSAEERAVLFLGDSVEEGRCVYMDVIDVERYTVDLTESIGAVPVRKARVDLEIEDGSLRLMEFIKSAIANSDQEQDTWWN